MKRGASLLLLTTVVVITSCMSKPEAEQASLERVVGTFPAEELGDMASELTRNDLKELTTKGQSPNWKVLSKDITNGQITFEDKSAPDNQVQFTLYHSVGDKVLVGVQQYNARNTVSNLWLHSLAEADTGKASWASYPMPSISLKDLVAENVILPQAYRAANQFSYLNVTMTPKAVRYEVNEWIFFRELEHDFGTSVTTTHSYVKYVVDYDWNGSQFVPRREVSKEYEEAPTDSASIEKDDPSGPGLTEFNCGHTVTVTASSTHTQEGVNSYQATNVLDGKDATAWAPNGDGIGEWIEFTIKEKFIVGTSYQIRNGYTKTKALWKANNRVKKLKVLVNNKVVSHILLHDTDEYQAIVITPNWMKEALEPGKLGTTIRFVIEEIYKGDRYNDTLLSHFVPTGNCG